MTDDELRKKALRDMRQWLVQLLMNASQWYEKGAYRVGKW